MNINKTTLQLIEFGEDPSDKYYCLIDLNISPNGMDIEKLKLSNPRNFDLQFQESGCMMMLTGTEINELIHRGDLDESNLHKSLYQLACAEGVITKQSD